MNRFHVQNILPKNFVVDGKSLLRHAYHGAKHLYKDDGEHIGGVYVFFSKLRMIMNLYNAKTITIFWDRGMSGKLRYDIYPQYKSNRKDYANNKTLSEPDESFEWQMNRVKQYAEELFIRQYEHNVVEADDGIAQYVIEKELQGEYNIVISGDKDLCQLISDQTFVYFLNKNVLIDKDNYNEYFNHYIENYLTVKAIDGDTSDTIKGVPRIGEKTLLKYFPKLKTELFSVNEMREEIDRIQSERKRPLKTLQTLQDGITPNDKGECIFNRNITLMDLSNPIMDDECREDIFDLATLPLDPDERDIKTLLNMMMDDGFMLLAPGGWDGYIEFLRPFDIIINQEKKLYYELQKEKTQV